MRALTRIAALISVLLGVQLIRADSHPEASAAGKFPAGLKETYRRLSESIRSEDLREFMRLFHLNFIYEAADGSSLDRGPWRRLWMERFRERTYERMAFEVLEVLEEEDERLVLSVRGVAVLEIAADGSRRLEETILRDTWIRSEAGWTLRLRTEREILSRGALASASTRKRSSPRVSELAEALRRGAPGAERAFWKECETAGTPLLEPIPDDRVHRWLTFLWRGEGRETSVRVRGGLPAGDGTKPLTRLGSSNVWYRTERVPANARFTYEFHLETAVDIPATGELAAEVVSVHSVRADPLARQSLEGASLARLPAAEEVPWVTRVDGRPAGAVKRQTFSSEVLGERRFVTVYTPPGYDDLTSPCGAVFVLDRGTYGSRRVTRTVLDNLLADKKIPQAVVFMVHSEGSRRPALEISPDFVRFLGEEVVAWARESYRIHRDPGHCVVGGNGPGGALAAATALRYPGVFGGVLLENAEYPDCEGETDASVGSAEECLCVQRRVARGDAVRGDTAPLRFFLVVGRLEGASVVRANRHLRDVLEARGYPTTYRSVASNHHTTTWQDALARGLMALLSP